MPRLTPFFLLAAAAAAIHIERQSHSASKVQHVGKSVSAATHKQRPVRRSMTMANSFAVLSSGKRQEPAAEGGEEPPAGDLPIDEEGYAEDWGTEHKSEPYPASSVGKQHHPNYEQTAAKIKAELGGHFWWWILAILLVVTGIAVFLYMKKQ